MSQDPHREEAWSEQAEGVVPDPAAGGAEYAYDPGAAYLEEGQNYAAAETGYYDAEGNYVDPAQGYYDPNAVDPAAYYDPNTVAADPAQAYYDPAVAPVEVPPVYAESAGVYDEAPPAPAPTPAPVSRQPAKKAAKKKVAHRNPQPKLSTPRTGTKYKKPVPRDVYGGGGVSFATILLSLAALAMLGIVVMVAMPKDLSGIKGYTSTPVTAEAPRNLLTEAQKVMIDRNADISFTEEEVNRYINRRLQGVQKGMIASFVKYRGTYVDFSNNAAEVVIEREVFGRPITMSVKLVPEEFRKQIQYKPTAWALGKIELGERNVKPVIDLFTRVRTTLGDEYEMLRQMTQVRFEEDRVVLDARL